MQGVQGMHLVLGVPDVETVVAEDADAPGDDDGVVEVVVVVFRPHLQGDVGHREQVVGLVPQDVFHLLLHLGSEVVDGHLQRCPCDGSRHVENLLLLLRAVDFVPHQPIVLGGQEAATPRGDDVLVEHPHHRHDPEFLCLLFRFRVFHEDVGLHPERHPFLHHRHEVVVVADLVEEGVAFLGQHLRTQEALYPRHVQLHGAAVAELLSEVL